MLNNQRWGNQNKLRKKPIITIYSVYQTKLFLKSLKKIKLADLPYFLIIRCAIFLFIIHLIGKGGDFYTLNFMCFMLFIIFMFFMLYLFLWMFVQLLTYVSKSWSLCYFNLFSNTMQFFCHMHLFVWYIIHTCNHLQKKYNKF